MSPTLLAALHLLDEETDRVLAVSEGPNGQAVKHEAPLLATLPGPRRSLMQRLVRPHNELVARSTNATRARFAAEVIRRCPSPVLRQAAGETLRTLLDSGTDQSRRETALLCLGLPIDVLLRQALEACACRGPWFVEAAVKRVLDHRQMSGSAPQGTSSGATEARTPRVVLPALPNQRQASPKRLSTFVSEASPSMGVVVATPRGPLPFTFPEAAAIYPKATP